MRSMKLLVLATILGAAVFLPSCTTRNQPPVAILRAYFPLPATAPLDVVFDFSESYDPDGEIVEYTLAYGDGHSNAFSPEFTQSFYTYQTAGSFRATLTVRDDKGATGTTSTTLVITDPEVDVTGVWTGMLHQSRDNLGACSRQYHYQLALEQEGAAVSGISRIAEYDTPEYYGILSLKGEVSVYTLYISEIAIVESNTRPGRTWCIKSAELQLQSDGTLQGPWEGPRGCGGEINISRAP